MITEQPKFTPAPWIKEVSRLDSGGLFTSIRGKDVFWDEGFVCNICAVGDDARHNRIANLITAAPEMYEAIADFMPKNIEVNNSNIPDDLVVPLNVTMGELRRLHAALSKARGE